MRNRSKNDYLTLPFPRLNGKPHPAFEELKRQAELLSLMPYGLRRGAGPYCAALLIDRDTKLRPEAYPALPSAGLWFPAHLTLVGHAPSQPAHMPTHTPPKTDEDRQKAVAKQVAKKWQVDDDDE